MSKKRFIYHGYLQIAELDAAVATETAMPVLRKTYLWDAVRVIGIGTYLVQGNAPDFVNGGLIGGFHKILRYLLTAARRRAIAPLVGPNPAYLQK